MEKDWTVVYSTHFQHQAELIKGLLEENEIKAIILSQRDSAYGSFGTIEVYVHRDFLIRAKRLIDQNGN